MTNQEAYACHEVKLILRRCYGYRRNVEYALKRGSPINGTPLLCIRPEEGIDPKELVNATRILERRNVAIVVVENPRV